MSACQMCCRLNYAMACVHEVEMVEQSRKRQAIARPWLDREEVRNRIMTGLQCSTNTADVLTDTLLSAGHVMLSDSGRGVRPAAVKPMPCTHQEQAA
jgi:hypothetical protein